MSYVLNPRYGGCGCGGCGAACTAGVGCGDGCGSGCLGGCGGRRHCGWNPCQERPCDCDNRRDTWPFYDGFCPGRTNAACGCACYGYFTQEGAICVPAGSPLPFDSHQLASACLTRVGEAVRFEATGAYLVQLCASLSEALDVDTVLRLVLNDTNVPGGRLVLRADCCGRSACVSVIVRAEEGSHMRVLTANALETSGGTLSAALTITCVA